MAFPQSEQEVYSLLSSDEPRVPAAAPECVLRGSQPRLAPEGAAEERAAGASGQPGPELLVSRTCVRLKNTLLALIFLFFIQFP